MYKVFFSAMLPCHHAQYSHRAPKAQWISSECQAQPRSRLRSGAKATFCQRRLGDNYCEAALSSSNRLLTRAHPTLQHPCGCGGAPRQTCQPWFDARALYRQCHRAHGAGGVRPRISDTRTTHARVDFYHLPSSTWPTSGPWLPVCASCNYVGHRHTTWHLGAPPWRPMAKLERGLVRDAHDCMRAGGVCQAHKSTAKQASSLLIWPFPSTCHASPGSAADPS